MSKISLSDFSKAIVKELGDCHSAIAVIVVDGNSTKTAITGISNFGIDDNAIYMAAAMETTLEKKLKKAKTIYDLSYKLGNVEVESRTEDGCFRTAKEAMDSHDEDSKVKHEPKNSESKKEPTENEQFIHNVLLAILDEITGGEDDADDD